jgi:hypothetical protein
MKLSSLSLLEWIKGILNPHSFFDIHFADSHLFQIFAAMLCDMLWFSINQAVHKGAFPEVLKLATNIKRISLKHFATCSLKLHPTKENWSKLPQDSCKVNFDAIFRENFSTQAAVCRNSKGVIIKILTQVRPNSKVGRCFSFLTAAGKVYFGRRILYCCISPSKSSS